MKSKWPVKRLSEVAEIQMGQSPKGTSYNTIGEGVPLINGPVEFGKTPFSRTKRTKFTTEPTKICRAGDLILCVRGSTTGRMNIAGYDSCIGRGVASIRSETYQDWINFFIHINRETIYRLGSGATFPNVSGAILAKLEIPIPPETEQKRIVTILNEAFEGIDRAIANTEKNLTNARELFESYLNAIFIQKGDEWVEQRLGNIATFRNGLNFTKNSRGESIKIVGVKDFQNNFWLQEEQLESVTIDGKLKEIDTLHKGDILTVRSNGNKELIGRCVLVGELSEKTSHSGFTIRIRIDREDIYLPFVVHFLKSRDLRKQLTESGGGISISSLNQQGLSLITLSFPSFIQQKAIVADIDELAIATQRLEAIYQQKLAALNELKQSILQKAFTGELTAETTNQTMKAAEETIAA